MTDELKTVYHIQTEIWHLFKNMVCVLWMMQRGMICAQKVISYLKNMLQTIRIWDSYSKICIQHL